MEEADEPSIGEILDLREEGALFAELEGERRYVLVLYELYPNTTTSNEFVQDPVVVQEIGEKTGLGPATDPLGWGIWEVDRIRRNDGP